MNPARLRQWWADLRASFWLRPTVMTVAAVFLADALVRAQIGMKLPDAVEAWVYSGGMVGARDVLGVIASATIGVAGTTFSITVAALSLASSQMGPRLLRNFTSDPGNQYALGALVATFAYSLVALRSIHEGADVNFVPQLAVSVGLLMAFACVGVLIWFLHHVAASISVDRVVALVQKDLVAALRQVSLDMPDAAARDITEREMPDATSPLDAPGYGYLRVLDDEALADWAAEHDAVIWLRVRPGGFILPGSMVGRIAPRMLAAEAQEMVARCMVIGDSRSVEQDVEFAVRQLVEIGLRALSPGINDPFTAIAVLDRLGSALASLAGRHMPEESVQRDGKLRLVRPVTDYKGLADAMFHMMRQGAATQPAVMLRLLEVLGGLIEVELDPQRRSVLAEHLTLARDAAMAGTEDRAARTAILARHASALAGLQTL